MVKDKTNMKTRKEYKIMDSNMNCDFSNVMPTREVAKAWFINNNKTEGKGFIIVERTITYSDWEQVK